MKGVTDTLGVARSNMAERVTGARPKRGPQTRNGDLGVVRRYPPLGRRSDRPTGTGGSPRY